MQFFVSVDVGTSSIKGCIYDENLSPLRSYSVEIPPIVNDQGYEHDPRLVYRSFTDIIKYLVKDYDNKITAFSFDTYNHSMILLDNEDKPLTNLITGMDLRAGKYVHEWQSRDDPIEIYRETGCPPLFIYLPTRILWLRKERPEILTKTRKILSIKDYLMMQIFGVPYLDYGTASGNGILNIKKLKYSDRVLSDLGMSESELGILVEGQKVLERLPKGFLREVNISRGDVALVPSTFDGAAQSFGLKSLFPKGTINLGTTAVVRTLSEEAKVDYNELMRFFCYYAAGGRFALGGSSNNCGSLLKWLKGTFFESEETVAAQTGLSAYELMDIQASRAPAPGSLIFLPFIHGERFPFRSSNLAGVVFGLKSHHKRSHIIRAAMEGVAFTLKSICEALSENNLSLKEMSIAGGASKSDFWVQVIADILGTKILKPSYADNLSCLGNAVLAYSSLFSEPLEKIKYENPIEKIFCPNFERSCIYDQKYHAFKTLFSNLKVLFEENNR